MSREADDDEVTMTTTMRTMLACGLAVVACGAGLAQEVAASIPQVTMEGAPEVKESELVLRYYTPMEVHGLDELEGVAARLFGPRTTYVGSDGTWSVTDRFLELDDTLIIRDSAENAEEIVRTLREIEAQVHAPEPEEPEEPPISIETFEYRPRYGRIRGLERFWRELVLPPTDMFDGGRIVENISDQGGGTIFVQETPARMAAIREYLERVDVPVQQATFSFLVIRGLDTAGVAEVGAGGVPAELSEHLRRLVPMEGFRLLSTGLLRSSVRDPLRISTRSSADVRFDLSLQPAAFDPETGELTLEKCAFVAQTRAPSPNGGGAQAGAAWDEQSFETALSLRAGEYTVLGSVGPDPLFVVLKLTL